MNAYEIYQAAKRSDSVNGNPAGIIGQNKNIPALQRMLNFNGRDADSYMQTAKPKLVELYKLYQQANN